MSQRILDALKALDVGNDNHWTADGLPRLDTVKMLAADPTLSRETVSAVAPGFDRASAPGYVVPAADSAGNAVQAPTAGAPTPETASGAVAPLAASGATSVTEGSGDVSFSSDQPEQPEMAATGTATDEVETLAANLEETRAEIVRVHAALAEGNKVLKALVDREQMLADKLQKVSPKDDTPSAIRAYLDAQVRKGEERAARKQLIATSGFATELKQLTQDLKSPLDAAMARKTSRGTQRPKL